MAMTCPCKKQSCPRHGDCKACREHHRASKRNRPVSCERHLSIRPYETGDETGISALVGYTLNISNQKDYSPEYLEAACRNSACYGVTAGSEDCLVGFARVLSDFATTYCLCDVIIDPAYQHQGLGTALVSHIDGLPEYAGLRGILITGDAHWLYRKFGYEVLNERVMVKGLNC